MLYLGIILTVAKTESGRGYGAEYMALLYKGCGVMQKSQIPYHAISF